jgi:hypothetical protein
MTGDESFHSSYHSDEDDTIGLKDDMPVRLVRNQDLVDLFRNSNSISFDMTDWCEVGCLRASLLYARRDPS